MIPATLQGRRDFIVANTRLQRPPHVAEIELCLADEITPIWKLTEEALEQIGLPPPFWAFAWAGGQALARYLIDNPYIVHSRDHLAVMLYHQQDRHYELRSIDVFINGLRQKLRDTSPYRMIRTERGQGYVFTPTAPV